MDDELRKLRGLVAVGATWGLAWGVIGAAIGLVIALVSSETVGRSVVEWALGIGAYGVVSGLGFGGLLAYHERRKTIDELSPARAALLGVLGAVLVPILFGLLGFFDSSTTAIDVLEAMAATAVLGGTFAGSWVALARSGAQADRGDVVVLEVEDHAPRLQPQRSAEPEPTRAREHRSRAR